MTKTRSTKSTLISSVVALFLCFAMLVGSTFAWFTDSVTSANNLIKAGNLDIALDYWDGDSWETVEGTDSLFTDNLWEPGHTEVVYLKLSNLGSLALKYQLAISVLSETEGTNMAGDPFKLSDYIQMGVVEGVNGQDAPYATREAAVDAVKDASGIIGAGYAKQGNMLADAAELYMAVVVYMPETVGNVANAKTGTPAPTINLGVQVLATQYTAEGDSFGTDYDEEAWAPGMLVYNEADLKAALANGGSVTLAADVEVTETIIVPEIDNTTYSLRSTPATVLNLNGYEISYKQASGSVIRNEGNLVITGSGKITSEASSYAIRVQKGSLTIDSATLEVTGVFGAISMFNDAQVTINGGTYTAIGAAGKTHHCIYVGSGADLVINGGTFEHKGAGVSDSGATLTVYAGSEGGATINGGTFIGSGTYINPIDKYDSACYLVINGGCFSKNPSAYVADGFKALESNGTYYVVSQNIDAVVSTNEELQAAVNACKEEIILTEGEFTVDLYNIVARDSLTITGQGAATKLNFKNQQVRLSQFDKSLTINNLEIGRMVDKSWGQLVFGGSDNAGGVYTISECIFNGLGTQGIYINQDVDATVNVEKCTFNGDFGKEGAITIQNNDAVFTVNVNDCEFNNIPENSHDIYVVPYEDGTWYLNVDNKVTVATAKQLANVVANGATEIFLLPGEYNVANCGGGKTLTLTGSKNAVLKLYNEGEDGCDYGFDGSTVTFNGLTINTTANTGNYKGYARMTATFNDCTFFGAYTTHKVQTFNNCTFDFNNGYLWIWGATEVNFNNCEFGGTSKTILAHGGESTVININDCDFAATTKGYTGAGDHTAVVEIDPTGSNTYTINFTGENTMNENYAGWTRVKDNSPGHIITGLN